MNVGLCVTSLLNIRVPYKSCLDMPTHTVIMAKVQTTSAQLIAMLTGK